jgi:hypothetical protein
VKILARGSVNLEDSGHLITAVAGLVPHSWWNKGNFSRTQTKRFPFDDSLDSPLQDDVNILGFSMVVRRTRPGIDVNQIDVHINIPCAVGFIHQTERFTAIPSHNSHWRVFYAHNLYWHKFTSNFLFEQGEK